MARPGIPIAPTQDERNQLLSMSRSRSLPHCLVRRARIIVLAADGATNAHIAQQCGISAPTVTHWKKRFAQYGLAGLHEQAKSGRPRTYDDEAVAALLGKVLGQTPTSATHWSVRSAALASGISKSQVARYFNLFGLQPHRSKSFKLSTDPYFVEKVRDIVGLYLSPPTNAVVLCVDEKSQCQALQRTQPMLPMGLGYVGRHARLHPPRHHHTVCSLEHSHRGGGGAVQAPSSSPGVPGVLAAPGATDAQGVGSAPDLG